jgi:hypothetical protein
MQKSVGQVLRNDVVPNPARSGRKQRPVSDHVTGGSLAFFYYRESAGATLICRLKQQSSALRWMHDTGWSVCGRIGADGFLMLRDRFLR